MSHTNRLPVLSNIPRSLLLVVLLLALLVLPAFPVRAAGQRHPALEPRRLLCLHTHAGL